MGKIDELIQQYCPDGVEWKKIEEVCKVKTPPAKLKTSDYQEQGLFLIIDQGQQQYAGYTDNEKAVVEDGEYILYGDHTCIVKYHKGRFAQGADGLKILVSKANNPKYVYYAFSAYNLTSTEYKRHWTQAKDLEIPLPPLLVQEAIVNILDRFAVYAAELQAELQARQQQYNYYRDTLLSFEGREDVQWKMVKLGEIASVARGGNFQKKDFVDDGCPCIHYGQIYTHYKTYAESTLTFVSKEVFDKSKKAQPNDIVMAITSENVEDVCSCVAWVGKEPIAVSGHTAIIHHDQNAKFLAYYFQTDDFFQQKKKLAHGTKVIEITPDI